MFDYVIGYLFIEGCRVSWQIQIDAVKAENKKLNSPRNYLLWAAGRND